MTAIKRQVVALMGGRGLRQQVPSEVTEWQRAGSFLFVIYSIYSAARIAELAETPPVDGDPAFYNYPGILNWPMPFGSRLLPYKERQLTLFVCPLDASPRPWAPPPEASPAARDPKSSAGDMHASMGHIQMPSPPSNYSKQVQTNRRNETRVLRLHGNSV